MLKWYKQKLLLNKYNQIVMTSTNNTKNKQILHEKILLDITTVVTLISDIVCDPEIESRYDSDSNSNNNGGWKKVNKQIYNQIINEKNDPIIPKLDKLFENKELLVTESAKKKVDEIIINFGSAREKQNLNNLLLKIKIIKDNPSDRFKNLDGRLWSEFNKNIFGTADQMGIPIVSGNMGALNFINGEDYDIDFIAHRSRCFVGKKYEKKNIEGSM